MSSPLSPNHFLNQPRQDFVVGGADGSVDTTTLAAHDFDVDTRTGFMPPDPPLSRLPIEWEPWEMTLDQAMSMRLQLAVKPGLAEEEIARSASWRQSVREDVSYFFPAPPINIIFTYIALLNASLLALCVGTSTYPVTHASNKGSCSIRTVTSASSSCADFRHARVYSHTPARR